MLETKLRELCGRLTRDALLTQAYKIGKISGIDWVFREIVENLPREADKLKRGEEIAGDIRDDGDLCVAYQELSQKYLQVGQTEKALAAVTEAANRGDDEVFKEYDGSLFKHVYESMLTENNDYNAIRDSVRSIKHPFASIGAVKAISKDLMSFNSASDDDSEYSTSHKRQRTDGYNF